MPDIKQPAIRNSSFGLWYDLYESFPGASRVILCRNRGYGYEPFNLRLPHQVYVEDVKKWVEGRRFEISVIGVPASIEFLQLEPPNDRAAS